MSAIELMDPKMDSGMNKESLPKDVPALVQAALNVKVCIYKYWKNAIITLIIISSTTRASR